MQRIQFLGALFFIGLGGHERQTNIYSQYLWASH